MSSAFEKICRRHDVTFIFPESGYKRLGVYNPYDLSLHGSNLKILPVHQQRQIIWKQLFQVSQLRFRLGKTPSGLKRLIRTAIGKKAALLYSLLSLPLVYIFFKFYCYQRLLRLEYKALVELLDNEKPDLIIHPCVLEGVYLNDIIEESRIRCIKTIFIMNSWDNPSTKRTMIGQPDWLLVWGKQTKDHAIKYANMKAEKVIEFGAAQFDIYSKENFHSKDRLCMEYGIDNWKRIILYAGSSKETDEFSHLCLLESAIESNAIKNCAIIYRPHPWGNGGYKGERILNYNWKHVHIDKNMIGYLSDLNQDNIQKKSMPNYKHTQNLITSVDAVISPLSTILLEAMICGKPVLCFLPTEERKIAKHFDLSLYQAHFKEFYKIEKVLIAKSKNNLIQNFHKLIKYIDNPDISKNLISESEYFVKRFNESYSLRLESFATTIFNEENRKF
jgi:hypothetical protein